MDYPNNDYSKQNQVFYDDETLLKEFSDPKEALDYDGDLVFFEDDVPPVNRGSIPPKKKGGKGMIFLIIAAVLLACSIAFAVIMILRTNGSNGSSESSGANSAASATSATQPDSGQNNQGTTASNDSAQNNTTNPNNDQVPVEDTTEAPSLIDFYNNSGLKKIVDDIATNNDNKDVHVEDNTLYIDVTYSSLDFDQKKNDDPSYIDSTLSYLRSKYNEINSFINPMRDKTGIKNAIIVLRGYDNKGKMFYSEPNGDNGVTNDNVNADVNDD